MSWATLRNPVKVLQMLAYPSLMVYLPVCRRKLFYTVTYFTRFSPYQKIEQYIKVWYEKLSPTTAPKILPDAIWLAKKDKCRGRGSVLD